MKTVNVQAIQDYMVCEFFYKCRYIDEMHEPILSRHLFADKFENTLKKVASFFFYKKQADSIPSYNALLNRWEKLWFPKDMTAYDIAVEQHEIAYGNMASFSNVAAASLEYFHNNFKDDPGIPVAINEDYVVPLSKSVKLEGSFDIVLKYGNDYRIIKWWGKRKNPKPGSMLLDFAAMRYAFEYRSEFDCAPDYRLYNLTYGSGKAFLDIDFPSRADIEALKYWAQEIGDAENFIPRRGFTSYCKGCPFDEPCLNFNDYPVMEPSS